MNNTKRPSTNIQILIALVTTATILLLGYNYISKFLPNDLSTSRINEVQTPNQIAQSTPIASPTHTEKRVFSGTWDDVEYFILNSRDEPINTDPPTTKSSYSSNYFEIHQLMLPYNPSWGTSKMSLPPYNEFPSEKKLKFGPLLYFEANIERAFIVEITPHRLAQSIYSELDNKSITDLTTSTSKTGYQVLKYTLVMEDFWGCDHSQTEVVGKSYNYVFIPPCMETYAPSQKVVDDAIDTLIIN